MTRSLKPGSRACALSRQFCAASLMAVKKPRRLLNSTPASLAWPATGAGSPIDLRGSFLSAASPGSKAARCNPNVGRAGRGASKKWTGKLEVIPPSEK